VRYLALRRANHSPASILVLCGSEILADAVSLVLIAGVLSLAYHEVERRFATSLLTAVRTGSGWVVAGVAAAIVSGVITRRYLPHAAARVATSVRDAWHEARTQSLGTLARAAGLTVVALVVRCAILPVLLARTPGLTPGQVLLGSAVMVYGQQLAPSPGGVGAVEIGAVAGFAQTVPPGALALLVVIWRTYALVLGSVAGGILLLRERRSAGGFEAPA
jgi:uncharacterized membrane protein YbhN (UPF0104 family)